MTTCEQIAGCEPDLDVVADMARTVAWNVTDPAMFDQLVRLCQQQPHRAVRGGEGGGVMHPVERILIASIIGVAICGVWIGLTWQAMR